MSPVIEGPAVLKRGSEIYIVYSASDSKSDDYCLGIMQLRADDVMNISSWKKSPKPVFSKTDTIFGPGHCSFTEKGGETIMVYHANTESGSGWYGRHVWLGKITWDADKPVFGMPSEEIIL